MKKILSLFACLFALQASAQVALTPVKGHVSFQIKNAGINVDGYFEKFSVEVAFSDADLGKSSIVGTLESASINTGIDGRDNHLRKEEYFDVAKFPTIKVQSKSLAKKGSGSYDGVFTITMKGVSKDFAIPFTVSEAHGLLAFKGQFVLNRRDFKVGGNSWMMSDQVRLLVEFTVK